MNAFSIPALLSALVLFFSQTGLVTLLGNAASAATASPTPSAAPAPSAAPSPSAVPLATAAPGETRVILPGGTPVTFQVTDTVSSGTAKVGDTFGIKVAKDVLVDDLVVVAKGAGGIGEVLKVDPAGSHGHAGSLGIQLDWVYGVDGNKVKLTSEQSTQEGENNAGVSSTMTIISWAFLGLPGLFMHNFIK